MELKPYSNAKRLEILKEVGDVESTNIEEYVDDHRNVKQSEKAKNIDTIEEHYETRPPAYISRFPENLNDEQTKDSQFYRK